MEKAFKTDGGDDTTGYVFFVVPNNNTVMSSTGVSTCSPKKLVPFSCDLPHLMFHIVYKYT